MTKKVVEIETRVKGDGQAKSKLGSLGDFIKKRFVITLGDIVRIGRGVVDFFVNASKKAQEQERVVNSLNQALKNQGIFTKDASKALQEQAGALQRVTTFGDEAIIGLQTMLINFGVMPKEIDRVTMATLDLATATGMNLNAAGNLLAKSLGSSTNALARYGIEITGAVGSSERLDSAVKNIAEKFGGQATAETETMAGSIKQLNNIWGDLQETIMTTNNNALTPYIKGITNILAKTNEILKEKTGEELIIKRLASLRNGLKILEGKFDPLGAYKDTIKKRKEQIAKLEEELVAERKRVRDQQTKDEEEARKIALEKEKADILQQKKRNSEIEAEAQEKELKLSKENIERKYNIEKETRELTIDDEIAKNKELLDIELLSEDERNKLLIQRRELLARKTLDIETKLEEEKQKMRQMFNDLEVIGTATKSKELIAIAKAMAVSQATMDAYASFNKTLASLPFPANVLPASMSLAQGLANVATIASTPVKFAQGGQFETASPLSMQTTSGQSAMAGERGIERVTVEPIGKPQNNSQSVNITVMLGNTELKRIAYDLKPYLNAIDRRVI